MKKIMLIALFAAIIVSAAAKETHIALAEMRKSPFGATILSAVQLNLAAGYDVGPIIALVDEIISQLHDAQAAADSRNASNQGRCETNLSQFERQIEETKNTIANLESSIALNEENLQRDTHALSQANSDYDTTVANIENGTAERENAHSRWVESDAEIVEALSAIDEATRLIQHMIHGVSFVQVKTRYDKVLEKLSTNKSKHSTLFKPLIIALSQISNQLNYEAVQKILNLLNNLRSALSEAQAEGRTAEDTAANLWSKLLEQLLNNKQRYSEEKSRLTDSISYLNDLLEQQKVSLENNRNALENFMIQLADEKALCERQAQEYVDESRENERETSILVELNEHLAEKFPQVVEFIQL